MIPILKKVFKKNERGSATIEFLGMVPFVFLLLVMVWQFIAAGFAVMTAQSAANEAAKIYSTTEDNDEAKDAAQHVVNAAGSSISFDSATIARGAGSSTFTATVDINLDLVFLPDSWGHLSIPIQEDTSSRVIQ